jgi:hypothetical protein
MPSRTTRREKKFQKHTFQGGENGSRKKKREKTQK